MKLDRGPEYIPSKFDSARHEWKDGYWYCPYQTANEQKQCRGFSSQKGEEDCLHLYDGDHCLCIWITKEAGE